MAASTPEIRMAAPSLVPSVNTWIFVFKFLEFTSAAPILDPSQESRNELLIPSSPHIYYLGPMGNGDPINFIIEETQQIPFRASVVDISSWSNAFRNWPHILVGWRDWLLRVREKKGKSWVDAEIHQCITLSLSLSNGEEWINTDGCVIFLV